MRRQSNKPIHLRPAIHTPRQCLGVLGCQSSSLGPVREGLFRRGRNRFTSLNSAARDCLMSSSRRAKRSGPVSSLPPDFPDRRPTNGVSSRGWHAAIVRTAPVGNVLRHRSKGQTGLFATSSSSSPSPCIHRNPISVYSRSARRAVVAGQADPLPHPPATNSKKTKGPCSKYGPNSEPPGPSLLVSISKINFCADFVLASGSNLTFESPSGSLQIFGSS